jgi:hypothetical protein
MGLRSRFLSWREKQDAIAVVEDMRRRVDDLRDQTRVPPFDYFVDVEPGGLTELLNRIISAMDDFDEAAAKCLAELRQEGQR